MDEFLPRLWRSAARREQVTAEAPGGDLDIPGFRGLRHSREMNGWECVGWRSVRIDVDADDIGYVNRPHSAAAFG